MTFDGNELVGLSDLDMRRYRRRIQIVFQDSGSAFNPRRSVGAQIAYPLKLFRLASPAEARSKVLDLLDRVGMLPSHYDRYIHEFSGGQRQRSRHRPGHDHRSRTSWCSMSRRQRWTSRSRPRFSTCSRIFSGNAS